MKSLGKVFAAAAFLIITNVFALGQNDSSKTVTALTSGTNNFVAASVERVSATSVKIVFDLSIANSEFSGPLSFSAQSGVSIPVDGGMILKMLDHAATIRSGAAQDSGLSQPFTARPQIIIPVSKEATVVKLNVSGISPDSEKPLTLILPLSQNIGSSTSGRIMY